MRFSDEDLAKYADGNLDAARTEKLLQAAQSNPDLADTLAALDASRLPFKAAFSQIPEPPLPPALQAKVAALVSVSRPSAGSEKHGNKSTLKMAAIAASVLIAFVGGYLLSSLLTQQQDRPTVSATSESLADDLPWIKRVAEYQSLYVPNTVKHIENDDKSALALLESIADSTGMKTSIPDLNALGYRFVRAQELGYEGETLVQLVYFKEGKVPLALCYMPARGSQEIQTTVMRHANLGESYWRRADQRFVIVADESEATLRELQSVAHSEWL